MAQLSKAKQNKPEAVTDAEVEALGVACYAELARHVHGVIYAILPEGKELDWGTMKPTSPWVGRAWPGICANAGVTMFRRISKGTDNEMLGQDLTQAMLEMRRARICPPLTFP
jgi:hypothetical protein